MRIGMHIFDRIKSGGINNGGIKTGRAESVREKDFLNKLIAAAALCVLFFFFCRGEVRAAFPADMEQKPVEAYAIESGTVSVYGDAALKNKTGEVKGSSLKISAYRVSDGGIYGSYKSGKNKGKGWFSLKVFVADPDYEDVYATVRDSMYIYEDESYSKVQAAIKKYTGVIVISREGGNRQVICDQDDHYEIGWMTEGAFSNTLLYDGREKRTAADGTYLFRCGYQDSEAGGKKKQTVMDNYGKYNFTLHYVTNDTYYIQDTSDKKYLLAAGGEGTGEFVVSKSEKPDEKRGLFQLRRLSGSYSIQSTWCSLFLGQDEEKALTLLQNRSGAESHWRISAQEKMSDTKNPFVFTQYDPQWCATPYGGGGCMGTAGCGILAAVNAVYALNGQYMDVMELADYAVEKEYRIVGSGTDNGIFKAACQKFGRKYGFAWDGSSGSIDELKQKLKAGDTAVVHVQGHYVCISDYNKKTKKFLLLDSNYLPKRATSAFGDWIGTDRLLSGALESQEFYFFKNRSVE